MVSFLSKRKCTVARLDMKMRSEGCDHTFYCLRVSDHLVLQGTHLLQSSKSLVLYDVQ